MESPDFQLRVILPDGQDEVFTEPFSIGRDDECDVMIDSGLVSRVHALIKPEGRKWIIEDQGSTNGTFVQGERVTKVDLYNRHRVQFGVKGPILEFALEPLVKGNTHEEPEIKEEATPPMRESFISRLSKKGSATIHAKTAQAENPSTPPSKVNEYINYYFNENDNAGGEHTQFIRTAFKAVQSQQQQRYFIIIGCIALLGLISLAYGFWQHQRRSNLEKNAVAFFNTKKSLDVQIIAFKKAAEEKGVDLDAELAPLEQQQLDYALQYDGFIRELGLYRELTEQERTIYDMARIFNENGFSMPASFVGEVKEMIELFWLGSHRDRYLEAIQRAERQGYTAYIVQAMQKRGLPPEFFYLALQESEIQTHRYGPPTRWGIAKGMWQFIPSTGSRFGLRVGPRADQRVDDPLDERLDFYKSTDAAARYLQEIYGTLAQASGLLVMASYNWGEHRIVDKLPGLPGVRPIREEIFEGIPMDPDHRNYWTFLTEYENRMPAETKDYVLKIFAAAVIGHNPRVWGINMDNPLLRHMENRNPPTS